MDPLKNRKVMKTIKENFPMLRIHIKLPPQLYDILNVWLPESFDLVESIRTSNVFSFADARGIERNELYVILNFWLPYSFHAVESIKDESTRDAQAIKLLLYLMMGRINDEYIIFCNALIDVGQIGAVEKVLKDCLHLIALGPMLNLKVQQTIVGNFIQLRGNINLPPELYDILQDWLPDSFHAVEKIKYESARNVQAIKLLNLMMRQTNDEFVIFCKTLIYVGQIDAVENVLRECLHLIALGPVLHQEVREAIVGYFIQLAFHINLPPELCDILQDWLPDSFRAVENIKYKTTKLGKATKLLHLMMQQTNDEIIISCQALICVGQIGAVKKFLRECLDLIGKSYEGFDEDADPPQGYDAEKMPLDDDHNTVQVKKCTKKFYEEKREQAYPMDTKRKGSALVINVNKVKGQAERTGTDIDRNKIVSLMEQLDFSRPITVYDDIDGLSHEDILDKVKAFAMTVHKQAQRVVVFILSHGDKEDVILGTNGKTVPVQELVDAINVHRLAGVPKMVVFQACRGDNTETEQKDNSGPPDLITCYSSKKGYVSYRNPTEGSWFIAALVEVFEKHAHEFEILELMNMVQTEVGAKRTTSGECQTTDTVHNLQKEWFLFPGYPKF